MRKGSGKVCGNLHREEFRAGKQPTGLVLQEVEGRVDGKKKRRRNPGKSYLKKKCLDQVQGIRRRIVCVRQDGRSVFVAHVKIVGPMRF